MRFSPPVADSASCHSRLFARRTGLGVSRSRFYDWQQAQPSARQARWAKVTREHDWFNTRRGTRRPLVTG